MIRVAILADTHANESSRWDEHCSLMDWCAADFDAREVSLVAHAGDVFEASSSPTERLFVADWARRVADRRPLLVVAGNHDRPLDVEHIGMLRAAHPIYADERPATRLVAGVAVASLPWPRKSHLLAAIGRPVSQEESSAVASQHLRNIIQGLGLELDALGDVPRLLVSHAMVDGALTNHDQPLVGADMAVSAHDLAQARAHFVGLGHIHNESAWDVDGVPVAYANTIRHTDFGTPGPTGYLIVEFDERGGLLHWERVATPARAMILLEGVWDGALGAIRHAEPNAWDGDVSGGPEIRLRYVVAADQRDAAKRSAHERRNYWLAQGAHSVKLDEVVAVEQRARAPDVAAARTTYDRLTAYWNSRADAPDEARRRRLIGKLAELEA